MIRQIVITLALYLLLPLVYADSAGVLNVKKSALRTAVAS